MIEPNFSVRLDALQHDLEVCQRTSKWERLGIDDLYIDDGVWTQLDAPINNRAKILIKRLKQVRSDLVQLAANDPQMDQVCENAWREYADVYNESQEVFQESMELIGGLILRDRNLDHGICQVADELIVTCSKQITQAARLTIPASQEALRATLGRIIRFRFPEWTYWTLPFTAHEYGHVVIDENPSMKNFVAGEIARMVAAQEQQNGPFNEAEKKQANRSAEYHIEELLADAFAVYTMGPAYGFATILHRFNLYSAYDEDDEHPSDAKRAWIVLAMLQRMNQETANQDYTQVINHLQHEWNHILALEPSCRLDPAIINDLHRLVDQVWDVFDMEFNLALYPAQKTFEGWNIAKGWAEHWNNELINNKSKLTPPPVSRRSKIRDVLNAAWYCRQLYFQRVAAVPPMGGFALQAATSKSTVDEIARVSEELCRAIFKEKYRGSKRALRAFKKLKKETV